MTQNEKNEIKIDLNQLATQKSLTREGLIQRQVYDDLRDRISKRLSWIEKETSEKNSGLPSGMGWVSFIDGTRGAGKSTFLHNALELLKEDIEVKDKLAVMDWVDPSRIETNEFILLIILNAIKERVNKNPGDKSEKNREVRDKLDKAFKEVAGGLVLFKKDHHPLNELDAELFLEIGLEEAGHSAKLRENLHELIKHACDLLQVKALLFSFDDADTKFEHAIDLLETLRKYLDTPRVMCVVTGDLELYTLLIRQNFRRELTQGDQNEWGTKQVENHYRSQQQIRMLDHLEEQYLLKLFPLRERHHLLPICTLANSDGPIDKKMIFILNSNDAKPAADLLKFTEEKIENGFRLTRKSDIDLYRDFLLMQPIRSVLQVLARLQQDQSEDAAANSFHMAMLDLALHSLYQYNIAAEEIAAHDLRALCEAVFEVAMDDGDPDTSAYLRPTGAKAHNRVAMYGLSAAVAEQLKGKPGTSIAYLFRSPGMVKLAHEADESTLNYFNVKNLRHEFKRHMGVGRIDDALGWARQATVALVGKYAINPTTRVIRNGIIGINQNGSKNFKGYQKVFEELEITPAVAYSLVKSSVNGPRTFASAYILLGLISSLLRQTESTEWSNKNDDEQKSEVSKLLSGIYENTSHVSAPPWIYETNTDKDEENYSEASQTNTAPKTDDQANKDKWPNDLLEWMKASKYLKASHPSSLMMGKIWTRLYFGLENISGELRPDSKGKFKNNDFASIMELFALGIVNAFLIEESTYHRPIKGSAQPIILSNPRSSSKNYLEQLNRNKEVISQDRLPLTFIIATCPLITGLISSEKVNNHNTSESKSENTRWCFEIKSADKNPYCGNFISKNDFEKLKKVAIQGKKPPPIDAKVKPKGSGTSDDLGTTSGDQ